jgi:hypothetical protein
MSHLNKAMGKIKLWQEECKLVVMIVGAIASVATFFYKLFHGGLFSSEAVKVAAGNIVVESRSVQPMARHFARHLHSSGSDITAAPVMYNNSINIMAVLLGLLSIVLVCLCIYFLIKVMKKHMGKI